MLTEVGTKFTFGGKCHSFSTLLLPECQAQGSLFDHICAWIQVPISTVSMQTQYQCKCQCLRLCNFVLSRRNCTSCLLFICIVQWFLWWRSNVCCHYYTLSLSESFFLVLKAAVLKWPMLTSAMGSNLKKNDFNLKGTDYQPISYLHIVFFPCLVMCSA